MSSFTCVCQIGFTGPKCQVDLSKPCESKPCQSGGICEVQPTGFTCKCPVGKLGIFCEKGNFVSYNSLNLLKDAYRCHLTDSLLTVKKTETRLYYSVY